MFLKYCINYSLALERRALTINFAEMAPEFSKNPGLGEKTKK